MPSEMELLHRVRGSLEVARNMVARSTDLCERRHGSGRWYAALIDASEALVAATLAIDEELGNPTTLGPAA